MKQQLTTIARVKNLDEHALIFSLLGYSATKLWNTAVWERREAYFCEVYERKENCQRQNNQADQTSERSPPLEEPVDLEDV